MILIVMLLPHLCCQMLLSLKQRKQRKKGNEDCSHHLHSTSCSPQPALIPLLPLPALQPLEHSPPPLSILLPPALPCLTPPLPPPHNPTPPPALQKVSTLNFASFSVQVPGITHHSPASSLPCLQYLPHVHAQLDLNSTSV